ncbi:MAG: HlyD family efflux transporter periplasmic adaptor subunit [Myxococcales bacterium]|nr:HlyD family efflux transporter periplasmic adaptor subunit [Myxococcales bacterium]
MRKRRRWWAVAASVLVAGTGGLWVVGGATAETTAVDAGEVGERIVARAVVVPKEGVAEVRSRTDGRVVKVLVREGQSVKAGDLLAEIEPESVENEVTRREAELDSLRGSAAAVAQGARPEELSAAEAELRATREELALAESRALREQRLADRGVSPSASADEAKRALGVARARVEAAEARVKLARAGGRKSDVTSANARVRAAKAAVSQAKQELNKTRVVAPIAGVVLSRRIDPGDVIAGSTAGVGAPAFEIADVANTELQMEVEEVDASRLVPGLAVRVTPPGRPETLGSGTVSRVGAQLQRRSIGAFDARERGEGWVRVGWIDARWEGDQGMPLGQRVEIIAELPPRKVTARVPRSAVRIRNGRATVDVATTLGFRETAVELGAADDAHVEVRGLPAGARVRTRR